MKIKLTVCDIQPILPGMQRKKILPTRKKKASQEKQTRKDTYDRIRKGH